MFTGPEDDEPLPPPPTIDLLNNNTTVPVTVWFDVGQASEHMSTGACLNTRHLLAHGYLLVLKS